MRLLVVDSDPLKIVEFVGDDIPQYAVLSHTWGREEVSFQDMQNGQAQAKKGYEKIRKCCELAAQDGIEYAWVDTCCIDKSSSSELQEAINSMYAWYENAQVCYVYLEDVQTQGEHDLDWYMARCRWATRGWTLQELISPRTVELYDCDWNVIGTKRTLKLLLSRITGIDPGVLQGTMSPRSAPVATRLSWAANRRTTRVEDEAYCLMGLFDVHMPMLYGEGRRAFRRLQEEILKQIDDHTLFAWNGTLHHRWVGLFATSPSDFKNVAKTIQPTPRTWWSDSRQTEEPPALSNRGLRLTLPTMLQVPGTLIGLPDGRDIMFDQDVVFGCVGFRKHASGDELYAGRPELLCIILGQMPSNPVVFVRYYPHLIVVLPFRRVDRFKLETLWLKPTGQHENEETTSAIKPAQQVRFRLHGGIRISGALPANSWDEKHATFTYIGRPANSTLSSVRLKVTSDDAGEHLVMVGQHNGLPWCALLPRPASASKDLPAKVWEKYQRNPSALVDRVSETTAMYTLTVAVKNGSSSPLVAEGARDPRHGFASVIQVTCSVTPPSAENVKQDLAMRCIKKRGANTDTV